MQMKVPASMAATAPLTIPMWYFDETDGIWREEGMGVLNGDTYSASVKHFSYWNFDAWFPIVKWGASFVYENGAPANQMNVCITIPALNTTKCAHTNMDGMVCGMVPSNEPLWMEVINTCNEIVYSQPVGPFSDTILMGPITIEGNMEVTAITGRAVNCALEPVKKGYARIAVDGYSHFAVLNELTGAFQMSVLNCGTNSFAISCVDVGDNKLSLPVLYDPAPVINTGDIIVCETNLEYVELEVAGFQDHIYLNFPDVSFFDGSVILYVADSINTDATFEIRLDKMTPGLQTPYFAVIGVNLPNGEWVVAREFHISVNITHFGEPGDYILGTLSGTLYPDPGSQGGSQHAFTGKFSILRE
jgi:hypothetical protein